MTKRSGKARLVAMRRACGGRLRYAYYHWARTAVQDDERSRAHHRTLRADGKGHGRALRGVVDRLLSVAVAMLRWGRCTIRRCGRRPRAGGLATASRPPRWPADDGDRLHLMIVR